MAELVRSRSLALLLGTVSFLVPAAARAADAHDGVVVPQLPERLSYDPAKPILPGYRVKSEPSLVLTIPGAILFGVPYGLSVVTAITTSCKNHRWLLLPIAGPFISASEYRTNYLGSCSDPDTVQAAVDTANGLVQGLGAVLFVLGELVRSPVLVREDVPAVGKQAAGVTLRIVPTVAPRSGAGIGVVGVF